ncbi:MAG: 4Fe-4S dicluster domain-containing protein [Candidatus Hodarchaeota archaeon]
MSLRIAVLPERCTGCRVCELVCSEAHEGVFQPSKARIQVLSFDGTVQDIPIVCQQCRDAPCLEACPQDALSRDINTDAVVLDADLCIQCGSCVKACVVGKDKVPSENKLAIRLDAETQLPLKCDLCSGNPQCVKFCPTEALLFSDKPVAGEIDVVKMMQALEKFLRQEELPLIQKEEKSIV